jgi:creatinine amidohydrolase
MKLLESTWEEVDAYLKKSDILIIPVGAIEQHGPMAPIGTDVIAAEEVAERIGKKLSILVAPTITTGYVDPDFLRFKGTLCIRLETFCNLLEDFLVSYSKQGFKKFVIVNTHETQRDPIKRISERVCINNGVKILAFEYWNLLKEEFKSFIKSELIHACEDEISILLETRPELVKKDRIVDEMPLEAKLDYFIYPLPEGYATKSGVMGIPSLATREKGKMILDLVMEKAAVLIKKEFDA